MKHSAFVLAVHPIFISLSPGDKAVPRRLRIKLWQTQRWMKKIIKLRGHSDTPEKTQTKLPRFKSVTPDLAAAFASEWIESWNARDLDRILKHYAPDVEFISPFVGRILGQNENTVRGATALRVYFSRALKAYPDLHFVARGVYCGAQSLVIEYQSVEGRRAAERMEFNGAGLVVRVRAHYGAVNVKLQT